MSPAPSPVGAPVDALIVGAGPVGLTLAALLARQGLRFRLLDQNAGPVRESRATDVHARTLELFERVGLAEAFLARGRKTRSASFHGGGRRIAHVPVHALDTSYPFILGIPQHETESILLDDLAARGVAVERGVRLEGFIEDDGGVLATLRHDSGRVEEARAAWILGCDGANSTVRRALDLPFEGASYPEHFMLADVRLDGDLPDDELHVFLSREGFFQILPLPGERRVRLFVDVAGDAAAEEPSLELFAALCSARTGRSFALSEPGWMSKFRVHRRMVPRCRVGRALLAGDAAHIHSPVGGQGMNTGIQDAFNLAWKLALVVRGHAGPALLDSYHAERHAIAELTLADTHMATRLSMIKTPVIRELRDAVSSWLSAFPAFSRWLAEATGELRLHVRGSPIVATDRASILFADVKSDPTSERASVAQWIEFGDALTAGDRAPDAPFGGPASRERFFDRLDGQRHLVLLFDGVKATDEGYQNLAAIAERVHERFGAWASAVVVVPSMERPSALPESAPVAHDPDGKLHCTFGARAECAYVVRPDGYVGYRGQPASLDAVMGYFERVVGARGE